MPQPAHPARDRRSLAIRLMGPVVAVGLAGLLLVAYLLWVAYGDALRDAENKTLNYAKVLENRIDATMRRIDGVLAEIARAVPEPAFAPGAESKFHNLSASLDANLTNFSEVLGSRLIDTTGQLRYSSGLQIKDAFNFSDRDWFKEALSAPAGVTIVSQAHIGRVAQEQTVVVARALRNANAEVYGVAAVPLSLNAFQKQFASLDMGAGGVIGLRRADNHTLLLRWPHLPNEVNKPLLPGNPIVQGVQAGLDNFNVQITSQTDGVPRIFGVEHSQGHPFYVVVGIAKADALAQWRQQAITIAVISLVLLVVVVFALWRLWVNETQRVAIQAALLESEARLSGLVNSALDAIISIDSQQRIILFNPAAQKMFGYSEATMSGQALETLLPEPFRARHKEHVETFAQQGVSARQISASRELHGLRADGSVFPIEASISRFSSKAGWLSTVILRDITQRKAAQSALEESQRELARSNADLEQFAYAASHDLIEPLRSVTGSVNLLQKRYAGQLDARADEMITHAVSGATRMQALIRDLLALSRIGSTLAPADVVSLAHALSEAMRNLEDAIQESNAQITNDVLPTVHAHSTQVTQLLQNLLANAIKFRGNKAAVVHVGARQNDQEWVFSVADQGIGIEAQHFARVFELFKRLHTREEYAGTGIGLALCKKIVERHGGRIWVESIPGQGACFYFTLPTRSLSTS